MFFQMAQQSGMFQGGSEIGKRVQLGEKSVPDITNNIAGYMRFKTESFNKLKILLEDHPVVKKRWYSRIMRATKNVEVKCLTS